MDAASAQAPRLELATQAGLAVPFGAFGTIDYLAGSAETVAGGMTALIDHLDSIGATFRFRLEETSERARLEIASQNGTPSTIEEFVLAAVVGRYRDLSGGRFAVRSVGLTSAAPPSGSEHAALYGAPVVFGARAAFVQFELSSLADVLRTRDPRLHETLRGLASQLSLGSAQMGDLEFAIRSRFRDLMRGREVSVASVARSLGMSERTLHRRLGEIGRRYQDVVDACREAEAERLLLEGGTNLLEVALALGFSDQSAFNRAFRRWKKVPPTQWRAGQLAAAHRA